MSETAWIGVGAIVATFVGPIAAVFVTRFVDHRREQYRRRLDLFRVLMRSRRSPLSADFVGALNLIEVEFFDREEVLKSWRALLADYESPPIQTPEENARSIQKREYLRTVLLSQIARALRFNIPDLEIFRGGYAPQGHVDLEREIAVVRTFFAQVATGSKAIPIVVVPPPNSSSPPPSAPPDTPPPPPPR